MLCNVDGVMIPASKIEIAPGSLPLRSATRLEVATTSSHHFIPKSLARHGEGAAGAASRDRYWASASLLRRIGEARAGLAHGIREQ
jgi:hypothetical protein